MFKHEQCHHFRHISEQIEDNAPRAMVKHEKSERYQIRNTALDKPVYD